MLRAVGSRKGSFALPIKTKIETARVDALLKAMFHEHLGHLLLFLLRPKE
jgi:hypothetical protein